MKEERNLLVLSIALCFLLSVLVGYYLGQDFSTKRRGQERAKLRVAVARELHKEIQEPLLQAAESGAAIYLAPVTMGPYSVIRHCYIFTVDAPSIYVDSNIHSESGSEGALIFSNDFTPIQAY